MMEKRPFNLLTPVPFDQVEIIDDFWSQRQKINREVSIHLQHQKLEEYRHIDNFRVAAGIKKGIHRGAFYFDSDLYKWLEAACLILHKHKDTDLEKKVDEIVELIINSQEEDGYLNTYYSLMFPDEKFSNLLIMHELYCMGHFFEAAVAHKKATGKEELITVASKCVDHLTNIFIYDKLVGAPGHQEIELALISLYKLTKEQKYLELAKEFIERRGNILKFKKWIWKALKNVVKIRRRDKKATKEFEQQSSDRYEPEKYSPNVKFSRVIKGGLRIAREYLNGKYAQLNVPVRDATEPVGHAVRAMYLYIAMADLYSETGDESLLNAIETIWERMVEARMYITGGTGSIPVVEGFGKDFKLDNYSSYSETCASIGNMLWNWRMSQITADAKYADLIEKLMYNGMLVGSSIDGTTYMYNNPLASQGKEDRREWYMVACCPSNIARTISSIEKFIYSISENALWIHQYIGSKANVNLNNDTQIIIIQESKFPWSGQVKIILEMSSNQAFTLNIRIPDWTHKSNIKINGEVLEGEIESGTYYKLTREWNNQDKIELNFAMEPNLLHDDPRVKNNKGRVSIFNGPLIYCLEQKDNKNFDVLKVVIAEDPNLESEYDSSLLGGINIIKGTLKNKKKFIAIPYYAWCNRGSNKMQVWNKIES
jgi:DUF1680 family protein